MDFTAHNTKSVVIMAVNDAGKMGGDNVLLSSTAHFLTLLAEESILRLWLRRREAASLTI